MKIDLNQLATDLARMDKYMALTRVYESIRDQMESDPEGCAQTYIKCLAVVNGVIGDVLKEGKKDA